MAPTDDAIRGYELSKRYPVSRERLYRALIDRAVLQQLWGVQEITVDARVGGRTDAVYVADGQDWSFTLTYTEIVPARLLKWITHFRSFPTKETKVSIQLTDADDGTVLTLRMENFETVAERDANKQAWENALVTLAAAV
jgi:uncharacterized protein YndB with AHSA1/START domain